MNTEFINSNDFSIEDTVSRLLIEKKLDISTAESCTGGLLAGRLINYPGISEVFKEGFITYSNEAKMSRLNVRKETLEEFGAVSKEVASEMVDGLVKTTKTAIGISVTGIAGPGGGSEEKPVGLVYVGLSINGKIKVNKYNFWGNREEVRLQTVDSALSWLKEELLLI